MQRNGIFWTLTLFVVGGLAYLIADYFNATAPAPVNQSLGKTATTVSRETTKASKRSTKNLNLDKKNNIKPEVEEDAPTQAVSEKEKENLENQFQALRDEQRKQWQEIFGDDRDKMRAVMRTAIDNHPEFSEMFRRSREIRDNWATSSDSEKPKLLAELTELRQKGLEIIKTEVERYNSTPVTTPAPETPPTDSPTPASTSESTPAAEPEAPKEPTVIM